MIKPTTLDAYNLLHRGSLVMAEMEANGIRIDVDYVKRTQEKIARRVNHLSHELARDEIFKTWKKEFGWKMKLGSRTQLATVLFDKMGYKSERQTSTRAAADADALEDVNVPFVKHYIEIEKLKKARSTYLANILFETVDGCMHPNFDLHLARTFRSASSHPNFQNIPIRDPLIKKLIRRSFLARPGHCIVDLDFKGSEVNAAAWYHKDPTMLEYIAKDPGRMHFDAAKQIYMLPSKLMMDNIRYCGKNMFVFPQFYGDWWLSCARNLWKAINRMNLQTSTGIPLKKWLEKKGITSLGTGDPKNVDPESFEAHLKDVEHDFWYNRFPVYQEWKEEWWEKYQEKGFFRMLTGFVVSGYINRKDCLNYGVQGVAFHCLLWCLCRISELLKKYKMKTKLIAQIHDDAMSDTPEKELENYIEIATHVITIELKKHWPWIITPMRVGIETTEIGGSWYSKKVWKGKI